jgi:beta-glucosidase
MTDDLRRRVDALDLNRKVRLLTGEDFWSVPAEPAIGLRRLVLSDGPAGVRGELWDERDPSANVPSPTALAASWDPARVERIGVLLAGEARRKGVDVLLAPTVNLHRSPYGGRHFECFSEDPLLTSVIGVAYVLGVQGAGVAATVKHFVANDSETERFTYDALIDERALQELYLAPFEAIVREGRVWAVMAAYNAVNGTTMTESPMLREILHGEWGFDGLVMSDWHATRSTVDAGNAALDLAMPGPQSPWGADLVAAVRDGRVAQGAVDDKLIRLLRLAERVGALDDAEPLPPPELPVGRELREAASAGFVLVRNEGDLLPLRPETLTRVAMIGPNAAEARTLGGGSATVIPPYTIAPLDGLRAAVPGSVTVDHAVGTWVRNRLAVAPVDLVSDPETGEPGVAVRLLRSDGSELARELRRRAHLTWLGGLFGGDVAEGEVARVEVTARVTAKESGTHTIGVSGIGPFVITIGGEVVFDGVISPDPGLATHEAMLLLPQWSTTVDLEAGASVDVRATYQTPDPDVSIKLEFNVEPPHLSPGEDLAKAVELARNADVAVVVVGTTDEVESEGFDRKSLALPGRQDELVRAVLDANPRTVVVVNSGAPVTLPWAEEVPAILLTWFPGQEFGNALADVLLGAVEPGGRLPVTWPASESKPLPSTAPENGVLAYAESVHIGHRAFLRAGVEPAFPFGHGLGYTTWDYEDLDVAVQDGGSGRTVTARVTVRNTGQRPGREVVQVYVERPDSSVDRPIRWLAGFAGVHAGPGERVTAEVVLPRRAFEHWDAERRSWTVEPGAFEIRAGRSVTGLLGRAGRVVLGD